MGLYDNIDKEIELNEQKINKPIQNNNNSGSLFSDVDSAVNTQTMPTQQSFSQSHPFISSIPEAGKQLSLRALKSYPEFAKGVGDATALAGDITGLKGLSDFGRFNAEFWNQQADKINIDPKYQGLQGLSNKATFLPTLAGEVGGQATNLLMAGAGGAGGAKLAGTLGANALGTGALTVAGTSIPNIAQEGNYLDKIEAFKQQNRRMPTEEELKKIQGVTLGEKTINTALETVSDKLLFGKLFPKGTTSKGIKKILKDIGEQSLTEAGTEAMQEGVSIGSEMLLGQNQGNNLERLAEATIIGGLTGGVIGGVASGASQSYDENFPQGNINQDLERVKEVSAKIISGGKELYNSATDMAQNAINNANNMVNQPTAFDQLRAYRQQSPLTQEVIVPELNISQTVEQLAPDVAEKVKNKRRGRKKKEQSEQITQPVEQQPTGEIQDTGLPNLVEDGNLYNVPSEQAVVNEVQAQEIAKNLEEEATKTQEETAVVEKPEVKPTSRVEELAPDIAKKMQKNKEVKTTPYSDLKAKIESYGIDSSLVDKLQTNEPIGDDYKISDIIENRLYNNDKEALNEFNKLKDDYIKRRKKIKAQEKQQINAQQEIENKYLNLKNKGSIYQGKTWKEIFEKRKNPNESKSWWIEKVYTPGDSLLSEDKFSHYILKSEGKGNKYYKNSIPKELNNYIKNNFIDEKYITNAQQEINQTDKPMEIIEKTKKRKEIKYKAPKEIPNGTSKRDIGGTAWYLNPTDKRARFYSTIAESNLVGLYKQESNNYDELLEKLDTGMSITEYNIVKYYKDAGVPYDKFNVEYESLTHKVTPNEKVKETVKQIAPDITKKLEAKKDKTTKKDEVKDGNSITETNGNRPTVSQEQEETTGKREDVSQEQSEDVGSTNEIRRGDNILNERLRGRIEKQYKNQFELNKSIEDFIKNKEYEEFGNNIPEEVSDWLKKYTGAGGLEKQGAEGKGLLSEYYTPKNIVSKMWDLTKQYINTNGAKVLEPSVGIGRFIEFAPLEANIDAVEMNPISAKITELLYPDANVEVGEFQKRFIDEKTNTPKKSVNTEYDIIIGNPPYGAYSGRYKGLGEGKGISRIETYFIRRGLDILNENGVMTFIVPSSFLDGAITKVKQEIGAKAELLDAYRLPENTFDTTSIGTDIIVLRKTKNSGNSKMLNLGNWFKEHPEKILGTTQTRTNRFGKEETFVKGDKSAVEQIETSKKDIKQTVKENLTVQKETKTETKPVVRKTRTTVKPSTEVKKGKVEYTAYVPEKTVSDEEMKYYNDTLVDGSLPSTKYIPNDKVSMYNGKLYNDFNYMQGNIYEKLDALEKENISDKQKEIQRKKLYKVLPKVKSVKEIAFNPTSDFIRELPVGQREVEEYNYSSGQRIKKIVPATLDERYKDYIRNLTNSERDGVSTWDIEKYINGERIRIDYKYTYSMTDSERADARKQQHTGYMAKLKNVVDKTFNDFVQYELSNEDKKTLEDAWNRNFNNTYNPNYKDIPLLVKDLNSQFYGNPLKLQDVQVEGINFLTNKGVGLLGFEVGVGKTLSGIVSTVQNMQMGRSKRPLIIVPNQVKDNWIREFKETFPNLKINDAGNMSKFDGKVEDGTVTVATYEALSNIWYAPDTLISLINKTQNVSGKTEKTERGREKAKERIEQFIALAEKGNKKKFTIQDLGFDHITVDEAHNFRNLFRKAVADGQEGNTYDIGQGGDPSNRAVRLFLLSQYILDKNGNRNVFMLTATPFNNSPLEVFNMLSFIAKDKLDNMGLYNVHQFMENYADVTADWIVNSKNDVEYKQVVRGFKNASSLREVIKNSMLIRSAEDAGIVRPNKKVNRVVLEPSNRQLELIREAETEATTGKKDEGAVLKAINKSRKATLSPDIASNNIEVSPEEFIKNSPKLEYITGAIETMVKKDPTTSQILYMPLGVEFLPKIKQYLINKGVFKSNEVEIIKSGISDDKLAQITDSFNDPNGKVKLIIGTQKIKEGMNLNKNSSVLYIPYLDWNPTDFVQVVGRIWRRGNKYKDIRVVVPLLKNSSDSFMFQKLDEKTSRINNLMDESKEYIDTGELNTAEEKINMISIPEKKVLMYKSVESKKLDNEKLSLEGHLETVNYYKYEFDSTKRRITSLEDDIKEYTEKLSTIDKDSNKWSYEYTKNNLDNAKKELSKTRSKLQALELKIRRLEIDFEGKDSAENIQAQIEAVEARKNDLEEKAKEKLAEYQDEYEKQRKESKSIKQLVKEFSDETENLYGNKKDTGVYESKPINVEPRKNYEKTLEAQYNVPVIKLETKAQKDRKSRKKITMEKAKQVIDAKKYDKVLKRGVENWATEINARRYDADKVINGFIRQTKNIAKELKVNDTYLREIMPFLRERTDFPSELNRPELKEVWEKVHKYKMEKTITDLADSTSKKLEKFWNEYQAVQAGGEFETQNIENYIPHEWDLGDKKKEALLNNFIMTKSKYAKQRKIESLYKGIQGIELENGELLKLTPKVLDYAKLLKMQSDSLIKATVDKVFADSVKSFKTDAGTSLILPASQAPSNWITINNDVLNKPVAKPVKTSYGEKISPELQNKLADIGIAIGRKLSKYKPNGMPNSLGKFVSNVPPEIRLQNWFSLKTLAHEVGHAMDMQLNLSKDGFVTRHRDELLELNKERIDALKKQGDESYATSDSELIAELFGVMFNDIETSLKYAPSATSEVLTKMSANDKLAQLLPANFDWKSAKHVLEEKVVEFFKQPVKVHPDIASTLKTVFEEKSEYLDFLGYKPGKFIDDANAVAKMFNFSLSGFHMWALSESYLGNVGATKGLKEALNFKKIYDSVKNGDYDIYKKDEIARQAIKDGLQIGATLDVQRGAVESILEDTGKYLEKNIPAIGKPISLPVKGLSKVAELNNKVLWDVIHNNYKLGAYEILVNNEKNITPEKRREIAQWVNDSFGGLVWEVLGIGKKGKRTLSRVLMSPDWLLATTRQFMGMFSSETGHKKLNALASKNEFWKRAKDSLQFLGVNSMTDDIEASGTRGRIARAFWLRAFIQSAIYMNVLNALFRLWDKDKNPQLYPEKMTPYDYSMLGNARGSRSTVFIGRNQDGTERYVRFGKQFREVPELLEDPFKKLGGKGSPMLQTISTLFTGKSLSGFENREYANAEGWQKVGLAGRELAEMYMPFSLSSAINKKGDYSIFDLVATTGKGMTKFKGSKQFEKVYRTNNNEKDIQDIERSMRMSGFNAKTIKTIKNRARGIAHSQYKKDYLKAIQSNNPQEINKVTQELNKKNVSPIEQRKLYTRALKDYYQSKGLNL